MSDALEVVEWLTAGSARVVGFAGGGAKQTDQFRFGAFAFGASDIGGFAIEGALVRGLTGWGDAVGFQLGLGLVVQPVGGPGWRINEFHGEASGFFPSKGLSLIHI